MEARFPENEKVIYWITNEGVPVIAGDYAECWNKAYKKIEKYGIDREFFVISTVKSEYPWWKTKSTDDLIGEMREGLVISSYDTRLFLGKPIEYSARAKNKLFFKGLYEFTNVDHKPDQPMMATGRMLWTFAGRGYCYEMLMKNGKTIWTSDLYKPVRVSYKKLVEQWNVKFGR